MQNKVVGINQSLREIKKKNAEYVYVAKDADKEIIDEIVQTCQKFEVEVKYVETKKELGRMANIQVKTAVLTILKEEVKN